MSIEICDKCARDTENTYFTVIRHILSPNIEKNTEIVVKYHPMCDNSCERCDIRYSISDENLNEYKKFKLTDMKFLENCKNEIYASIRKKIGRIYIANDRCYGDNRIKFLNSLSLTDIERKALEILFSKLSHPVVIDKPTANKILSYYWSEYGYEILKGISGDDEIANELYRMKDVPSNILRISQKRIKEKKLLAELPIYRRLPPVAEFADHVAREYLLRGEEEAVRYILQTKMTDTKIKSVAYAFLDIFGKSRNNEWRFTQIEMDFGKHLEKYARELIHSDTSKYHSNLQNLLSASGSTEKI